MDDPTYDVVRGQQRYYRRRAGEYDATSAHPDFRDGQRLLAGLPIHGHVLELACGTGRWTPLLAERADRVTAVDGAPEMLEIARTHVVRPDVEFLEADLFEWAPSRRYDTVFFAFWLSHVPPALFASFWEIVGAALRPDGRACFLDESDTAKDLEQTIADAPMPMARRWLGNDEHHIVKVFHRPAELVDQLAGLGWSAEVHRLGDRFLAGTAQPLTQPLTQPPTQPEPG
jgi:SAM-dependent methyltransferase